MEMGVQLERQANLWTRTRGGAAVLAAGVLLLLAGGCGSGEEPAPPQPASALPPVPVPTANAPRDVAVLEVEGFGEIEIELLHDLAPRTVANFVELAERDFYDGTTFHRVIPGFMIQGGDPLSRDRDPRNDGLGGPDHTIEDEFSRVSHLRGIVSMANRGQPGTAGSQFFIVVADTRNLDGRYSVFGRVVDGLEVVDRIAQVERDPYGRRGPQDRPVENVVIADVRLERGAGGQGEIAEGEAPAAPGKLQLSPMGGANPPSGTHGSNGSGPGTPPAARDPNVP